MKDFKYLIVANLNFIMHCRPGLVMDYETEGCNNETFEIFYYFLLYAYKTLLLI